MTTNMPQSRPSRYSSVGVHACPKCRNDLYRIRRRTIDRVTSLFVPVQRFRCHFFSCHWEGTIRVAREDLEVSDAAATGIHAPPIEFERARKLPKTFVVHMVLTTVGLVTVLVFTTTDWLTPTPHAGIQPSEEELIASSRAAGAGVKPARVTEPPGVSNGPAAGVKR